MDWGKGKTRGRLYFTYLYLQPVGDMGEHAGNEEGTDESKSEPEEGVAATICRHLQRLKKLQDLEEKKEGEARACGSGRGGRASHSCSPLAS